MKDIGELYSDFSLIIRAKGYLYAFGFLLCHKT